MLYYFLIIQIDFFFKKIEYFIIYYKNYNISLKEKNKMAEATYTIICSGGQIDNVEGEIIKHFKTLQNVIDDCDGDDPLQSPFPAAIMGTIIDFARKNMKDLHTDVGRINDLTEQQKQYIPTNLDEMFELFKAVNYLDFKYMLQVLSKSIAETIKKLSAKDTNKLWKDLETPDTVEEVVEEVVEGGYTK